MKELQLLLPIASRIILGGPVKRALDGLRIRAVWKESTNSVRPDEVLPLTALAARHSFASPRP